MKNKFYAVQSKHDNFLYGVFPLSKKGYSEAKKYIKLKLNNDKNFYIKKK